MGKNNKCSEFNSKSKTHFFSLKNHYFMLYYYEIKGVVMGLFKRKKEMKKEEINLKIKNPEDELFEEEIKEEQVVEEKDIFQLKEEILNDYYTITKKNDKMIRDYYICKIFSRVGLKDLEFNLQIISIDKNVNRIKKDCFYISRMIDRINHGLSFEYNELKQLNKQLTDLKAFQIGVLEHLNELNNGSFGHLKISTVTVTINKTNEELEALYNSISNEIANFKSFEEASEYIYYNSGDFIDKIVNRFILCIQETTSPELINLYNKSYFLPSDVIISLDVKEWIDLYNKLKFVLKQLSKYNSVSYPGCFDLFSTFESKYAILMMRSERIKK